MFKKIPKYAVGNRLDQINNWTENQKIIINEKKTKTMVMNFTEKYQFATRLQLKDENVKVINGTKILGTIISDDLKCYLSTQNPVARANARMALLRKMASFGGPLEDFKKIHVLFIRSMI